MLSQHINISCYMIQVPTSNLFWTGKVRDWNSMRKQHDLQCPLYFSVLLQRKVLININWWNMLYLSSRSLDMTRSSRHCLATAAKLSHWWPARLCSNAVCAMHCLFLHREVVLSFSPSRFLDRRSCCTTAAPWEVPSLLSGSEFFAYCSAFKWEKL